MVKLKILLFAFGLGLFWQMAGGQLLAQSADPGFERPYFKVYGGDISAGGIFGTGLSSDACETSIPSEGLGRVLGWVQNNGSTVSGSSVEYMARALGSIDMFYSASQRTSSPSPTKGLSLANVADPYGGYFGQSHCIANFWRNASSFDVDLSSVTDLADLSDGNVGYSDDSITLSDSGGDPNLNASIYVNGDIRITSNIINNRGNWNNREEVGAIYIVAKGDIFINSSVDEIDAVLVAIPRDDGSRGRVYTCRNTSNAASSAYPGYNTCNNKLTINGAVVAKELHLGRVGGSVEQSRPGETAPDLSTNPEDVGCAASVDMGFSLFLANRSATIAADAVPVDCGNLVAEIRTTNNYFGQDGRYEALEKSVHDNVNVVVTDGDGQEYVAYDVESLLPSDYEISQGINPIVTKILNVGDRGPWTFRIVPNDDNQSSAWTFVTIRSAVYYTRAAEIINYVPELFLARQLQVPLLGGSLKSDSVVSLPPVL